MLKRILLAAAVLSASVPAALADDAGLYDPAPPADSAFVRFVDASLEAEGTGTVGSAALDLSGDGVSPFVVVPAGSHDVAYGGAAGKADFAAGNYYTVVFNEPGAAAPVVIKDEVLTNPAKAGLHFYNLTGEAGLTLAAVKQNVAIFENVGPGEMKFRPVGAVDVDLAVKSAAGEVSIGSVKMERRAAKSVMVVAASGGLQAIVVDNAVER